MCSGCLSYSIPLPLSCSALPNSSPSPTCSEPSPSSRSHFYIPREAAFLGSSLLDTFRLLHLESRLFFLRMLLVEVGLVAVLLLSLTVTLSLQLPCPAEPHPHPLAGQGQGRCLHCGENTNHEGQAQALRGTGQENCCPHSHHWY